MKSKSPNQLRQRMEKSSLSTMGWQLISTLLICLTYLFGLGFSAQGATPENDLFSSPIVLSSASLQQSRSTSVGATKEIGESDDIGLFTVWWKWTSPANGLVTINTDGSAGFMKYFTVSMGDTLDAQLGVAHQRRVREGSLLLPTTAGTTYYIVVGGDPGYPNDNNGAIVLNLLFSTNNAYGRAMIPVPSTMKNDRFSDRSILFEHRAAPGGFETSAVGYSLAAGEEPFEPWVTGIGSVWWEWRAPITGTAIFNTIGSQNFMKHLVVAQGGDFSDLTPFAYVTRQREPSIAIPVTEGTVYKISVGGDPGYGGDNRGFILLNILVRRTAIPTDLFINTPATSLNDQFNNRVALIGGRNSGGFGEISAIGSNVYAVRDAFEPTVTGEGTVWWVWTAPGNGTTRIHLTGSDNFMKHVAVFTGQGFGDLVQIAAITRQRVPQLTFEAVAGTQYSICVGGDPGYSGDNRGSIVLNIAGPEVPESNVPRMFRIRTAVELEVETEMNSQYQLQSSPDLASWSDMEPAFTGDGSIYRLLKSTREAGRRFFRLKISTATGGSRFVYP